MTKAGAYLTVKLYGFGRQRPHRVARLEYAKVLFKGCGSIYRTAAIREEVWMTQQADLLGVYLFVQDLDVTLEFYSLLGLSIERVSPVFARAIMPNGTAIEFGCAELTRSYDPRWQEQTGPATNTINFELPSREEVDTTYEALVGAGHRGHLAPCDPPWQARFALVDDPDGNIVGLHSPRDREAERVRETA